MTYDTVATLLQDESKKNQAIVAKGWVRTRRDSKAGFSFIQLYDGSCFECIQVLAPNSLANYETVVLSLTTGCAIQVSGRLLASPAAGQAIEVHAEEILLIGGVEHPETYPMSPKHHTLEYLREYPHLRPRTNVMGAVTRVRHTLAKAIHQFFDQEGFYWLSTPIITPNDCEGAGELFRISTLDLLNPPLTPAGGIDYSKDFFGKETFLSVSGQLNAEAYCSAVSKVYTFGPAFRSENSHTSRHLAEFWMVEPEVAFIDLQENAILAERLLKFVFQYVLTHNEADLAFFAKHIDKTCIARLEKFILEPFEHMSYTTAIEYLKKAKNGFTFPVEWGLDLQSEHERYLTEQLLKKPLVVTDYPSNIKAFYMRLNADNKTVAAMDILVPGIGEIIGGSQREERFSVLQTRMQAVGLREADYAWYLDLRRYGSVPHSGFGLGFERLLNYLTGLSNIRDVIPFPRTPGDIVA